MALIEHLLNHYHLMRQSVHLLLFNLEKFKASDTLFSTLVNGYRACPGAPWEFCTKVSWVQLRLGAR